MANYWITTADGSAPVPGGTVTVHSSAGLYTQGTVNSDGTVSI